MASNVTAKNFIGSCKFKIALIALANFFNVLRNPMILASNILISSNNNPRQLLLINLISVNSVDDNSNKSR